MRAEQDSLVVLLLAQRAASEGPRWTSAFAVTIQYRLAGGGSAIAAEALVNNAG